MLHLADLVMQAKVAIKQAQNIKMLELARIKFLGKQGLLTLQIKKMLRELILEKRQTAGVVINQAKQEIQQALIERKATLESSELNARLVMETLDVSLPGRRTKNGGLHPVTRTINQIESFFSKLGFSIVTGPEIEDSYHNFDALNIPVYHPARDDHDTFWFDTTRLLRTQTSGMQIRTMLVQQPPIRIIAPGRVYRNDHDQTHTPMFHQIEGLIIDTNISFTHLKGMLHNLLCNFFEADLYVRTRPSYFPFTTISAEVDIMDKNGCWLEVLGCGMVHPNVFRSVNINLDNYSGFAFGMGVERLAMLRYNITDLRTLFENDLRFLKQFK